MERLNLRGYVPRPQPTEIPTAAWNDTPLYCLKVNDQWVSHLLGVLTALDQPDTWIGTAEEIDSARQQVNEIMLALMAACPMPLFSFWTDSDVPDTIDSGDDGSVEVGVIFQTTAYGNVNGLRFYKSAANTGTHTGHLFAMDGTLLGSLEFADETSDGWQTAYFDEPVAIASCTLYIAAYHAPNGHYSYSRPYFDEPYVVPVLSAPTFVDGFGGNGVYNYGGAGTFPFNSFDNSNYFVDVIFEPTGADYQ